jgi:putative redox protein
MSGITLRWLEEKLMVGTDSNGHSIVIGRSPDPDFVWAGIKPSDLLMLAAAACSAYDVVDILSKQREPLRDLKVVCNSEQASEPPYRFTSLDLKFIVYGAVKTEKLERAIDLSVNKYCSVLNSFNFPVNTGYEIVDE